MKCSFFNTAKSVLLAAATVCALNAATVSYTVNNLTLSGGDPTYSVATNVTFNSLSLQEVFSDSSSRSVTLFDQSDNAQTSLDTTSIDLSSAALSDVDPIHGAVVGARLSGTLSTTNLSILTTFGGMPISVNVNPTFLTNLSISDSSVNIIATGPNGMYALGTLDETRSTPAAVPEPASLSILSAGFIGLFVLLRRSKAHNRQA